MTEPVDFRSFARDHGPVSRVLPEDQTPLPSPFDQLEEEPWIASISSEARERFVCLDDTIALRIPKPQGEAEEKAMVDAFLSGLRKLFSKDDNWTFLAPLLHSVQHCARCQTCSSACPIFEESGRNEL